MPLSIEDRLAIQDLVILYGHFHDSQQAHRIATEIFTDDAVIDFGTGAVEGGAAISAFFAGFAGFLGTSHNISNLIVEGDGDEARCHSHCLAWHWVEQPKVEGRTPITPSDTLAVGGYDDKLRKGPNGWRIYSRRTLQYGTGLGAGTIDERIRPIFEGCVGRIPNWP